MKFSSLIYDVVVIGAGGAGLRAGLELASAGQKVAIISKVFPTRSHTVSAQGGITCALGNADANDKWQWHMYDTVKGSDYLGDQDAIEYLCKTGPEVVYELEHMGLPFSRTEDGKIYQRPFGGQSKNFGQEQAARTCAAADRTGHALLHTLFQQALALKTQFFNEWYALDLVTDGHGTISGLTALEIATGEVYYIQTKAVILATGGAGNIYQSTTNALINTGDGLGMTLRAGLPLQDMEMWQFHPTGIAAAGVLMTEGCRGEGGYLINKDGERFMERYAPQVKDLASRDVVARAIAIEVASGRGYQIKGVGCVKLKLDHLGADILHSRLPGICELAKTFAHVDPVKEAVPVVPTCHYMMGGIPTNRDGQVLTLDANGHEQVVPGLFAVGECACVSVHGANRLGGNSLLDLVVFGRAAGQYINQQLQSGDMTVCKPTLDDVARSLERLQRWNQTTQGENVQQIQREMQAVMQLSFGVFRTEATMRKGLSQLQELKQRLAYAHLPNKNAIFNTMRIQALELDNLLATAMATAASALARQESRGAHYREDYPKRDDKLWLKHVLYYATDDRIAYRSVNLQPLSVEAFQPKQRTY